jgi:Lactate dehydrogenase and related dehydrogenases
VKYGVGYDNLDTAAAAELGVFTVNVPDYCVEEVALQALSLIMNGLRFSHFFGEEVRRGNWIKDHFGHNHAQALSHADGVHRTWADCKEIGRVYEARSIILLFL